jgi:selenium metabolism protein YedF
MVVLNMLGQPCPIPVINAKKALRNLSPKDVVTVLVDNDIARQNLEKMSLALGHEYSSTINDDKTILVTITVGAGKPEQARTGVTGSLVVAIGTDTMGAGPDEALGKTLMKAFIHSLTELDTPAEYLLFFNAGAFLTTEGSGCLSDLEVISNKGAVISTCGACLNFYGLTEKLKIGAVTNMYAICSTMAEAGRLINI